jgi:hypothetical protein
MVCISPVMRYPIRFRGTEYRVVDGYLAIYRDECEIARFVPGAWATIVVASKVWERERSRQSLTSAVKRWLMNALNIGGRE